MLDHYSQYEPAAASPVANSNQIASSPLLSKRNAVYVFFWIGVGLLLSLAALQSYVRHGGKQLWEPFCGK